MIVEVLYNSITKEFTFVENEVTQDPPKARIHTIFSRIRDSPINFTNTEERLWGNRPKIPVPPEFSAMCLIVFP